MNQAEYPYLSRLVESNELWEHVEDFEKILSESKKTLPDVEDESENAEIARQLHDLAYEHFYLTLIFRFKTKEIARGIFSALGQENYIVFFNLARAFMEHTSSLAYQVEALEKAINEIPTKQNAVQIQNSIGKHRNVVQRLYYGGEGSPVVAKRLHVNDLLEALNRQYENCLQLYNSLCEFVHPNYGSNALVSSGKLASGNIGSNSELLVTKSGLAREIIERCADIDSKLVFSSTRSLIKISNWIAIAARPGTKSSQIFSLRTGYRGDGSTKETAIFFEKARTHHEAMEAFYKFLTAEGLEMQSRQVAGVEEGFLFDIVSTSQGPLWVKYRMIS